MSATKEDALRSRALTARGIMNLLPKTRSSDERTRRDAINLIDERSVSEVAFYFAELLIETIMEDE